LLLPPLLLLLLPPPLLLLLLLLLSRTGIEVFPDNLAAGIKFSWPTYKSGLRVMIHADLQSGSTWAFSEIFHWEVGALHRRALVRQYVCGVRTNPICAQAVPD
jgi:hypothetical protein